MTGREPASGAIPPLGRRGEEPDVIAPDGSEIRLLLNHLHDAEACSMVEAALPAGQVTRPVYHQTVEEVWYILAGSGQVWRCPPDAAHPTDAPSVPVGPGDALVIPVGWFFQFRANDDAELRFVCVTMPPWPGDDEAQPALFGGLGEPTV